METFLEFQWTMDLKKMEREEGKEGGGAVNSIVSKDIAVLISVFEETPL